MKKLNSKGFTLIELLAVITIMGILMLVAIPAVSRTIENSRRDTFMDNAKSYINAMKNAVAADELYYNDGSKDVPISAAKEGCYYYGFDTSTGNTATDLMEQGGRSSWGNADVKGYVLVYKTVEATAEGRTKYEYGVKMIDAGNRGIVDLTAEDSLKRSSVVTKNESTQPEKTYNNASAPTVGKDKWSSSTIDASAGSNKITCSPLTIG